MLKRILFTFFLVGFAGPLLYGQSAENSNLKMEKSKTVFDMGIIIGLTSYEDIDGIQEGYQRIGLYPQLSRGLFRLGFDFTLGFDGNFNLRDLNRDGYPDTWTTFSDWLYKMQFIEYANRGDPIYGLIGEFERYNMGRGMLMKGFNNNLFYPYILQRGFLFDFDASAVNFPYVGIESIVNDILDWDVLGARLFVRPFAGMTNPLFSQFELGASFVADFDPLQEYATAEASPPGDNDASDTVTTFGLDAGLPLIRTEEMNLMSYVDWGIITGRGQGIAAGADFNYTWIRLLVELRFLGKEFVPNYFDSFYWVERPYKYDGLIAFTDGYFGYLFGTDLNLWNFCTLYLHWDAGLDDVIDVRIMTGLILSEKVWEKIGFHITYDKKGIGSFKDFTDLDNSRFEALFEYRATDYASIVFLQQQSFIPLSAVTTSAKSVSQTSIETRFRF